MRPKRGSRQVSASHPRHYLRHRNCVTAGPAPGWCGRLPSRRAVQSIPALARHICIGYVSSRSFNPDASARGYVDWLRLGLLHPLAPINSVRAAAIGSVVLARIVFSLMPASARTASLLNHAARGSNWFYFSVHRISWPELLRNSRSSAGC